MQSWSARRIPRLPGSHAPRQVQAFDTLRREIVPIGPESGRARMYVCGITPYDATHIGHAATYVAFDLLNRVWRDAGLQVAYVQNVTDVDDPLLERAAAEGVDWRALADQQTELYRQDMFALNVLPPDHLVGAVESMPQVVELTSKLQDRGAVYAVEDPDFADLYFAQDSDAEFGSLGRLSESEALQMFAEKGGDPERPGKKAPLDCVVWRLARAGEPAWESAAGAGRPGWHIECTAIALDLLGPDFDVQGGGSDLVFPHHEMSAAHGRVATDQRFARAYLHCGMVGLDGEKMSKSRGNLVFVSRLRESGVDPMAIRLALLANHYRDDWDWSEEILAAAEARLHRWRAAVRLDSGVNADDVLARMRSALTNDLDAPTALAAVDAWADASIDMDSDDTDAPNLVARACEALLGVTL
jgi:L-cysteine:1D-myo-inositol 2-amino-2-deoxy-alpha-D-glucopyranoside ligase